ncbi:LytR/AlgR family response regulator transcription factor [Roseivirga misakiensis]|uniref:HTH LytTR-type domain-containing protein n=1 Tax=Roseivirga misakiensis TaxID=1563681 RepID=A0A1E5SZ48_9BACT|nr:LytTR family DNA-binding domain-containing protein [Roseivirga misakiensis]OEK04403.1 hypothetical protein BFP71_13055 [Roseivirga misakiensis]
MINKIEKNRVMKMLRLVVLWLLVFALLVAKYAQSTFTIGDSLYFCFLLFPVIFGTSVFFNQYLVPKYLLTGKYRSFALYAFYLLIVSVYLETWVIILALVLIGDYQFTSLNPEVTDILNMALVLYAIVFIHGFSVLFRHFVEQKKTSQGLLAQQQQAAVKSFVVVSDRKKVRIEESEVKYIESLGDYVKVHTIDRVVISKSTISNLEAELSADFVRIHRSFLVNKQYVDSFTKEKVNIQSVEINITRKYKESALNRLSS